MTTYKETQDLIAGQKQHSIETGKLFKTEAANGMSKTETIYCQKFAVLYVENGWNLETAANILNITKGECLDILECKKPFTKEHEDRLLQTIGIKISTIRLDNVVRALYDARVARFREIYEKYSYAVKPIIPRNTLFNVPEDNILYALRRLEIPGLGICLKGWRAANHETQYSVADKIRLNYPNHVDISFCKRDCWHNVEINDKITQWAHRAFYLTFGCSIEQAIAPMQEFFRLHTVEEQQEIIKELNELQYLERVMD